MSSPLKACARSPSQLTDEDECNPLIKFTLKYINRNITSRYDEKDFIHFLKFNEVRAPISKATKQLESFLRLYFPESPLCKSFSATKTVRYAPYRPIQPMASIADTAASEASIPCTPPSSGLRRAGSFNIDMIDSTPFSASGAAASMNLVVNFFPSPTNSQANSGTAVETMMVKVMLPDDSKTQVRVATQATVTDLRFELRKLLLSKYPAKRTEDVPLDKLVLKSRMGWTLNLADRVSDVVHEDTIVHCFYVE